MNSGPILRKEDIVFLISPSYSANKLEIEEGIKVLKTKGLQVQLGKSIFKSWGNFSGTDNERLTDLQEALDSTTAKAIICIRGGYGLSRIISRLSWEQFIKNPKWLIGFSDITLLHIQIQKFGLRSIHGLMAARFAKQEHESGFQMLYSCLFNKQPTLDYAIQIESDFMPFEPIEGKLIGGNLTMIVHTIGTVLEPDFSGKILFLEEVGEPFYKIDRMLYQLKLSEKLKGLKAIVLGQFTECNSLGFPLKLEEIFKTTFLQIPTFSGLQSGHGTPNFPLILGENAIIQKSNDGFTFTQLLHQNEVI